MDEKEMKMTKLTFSVVSSPGAYALLLGSGVSRSANILTGWEVTLDLLKKMIIRDGGITEDEIRGWKDEELVAWYKDKFDKEPSYDDVLDSLSSTPADRRNILNQYFEPTDKEREDGYKVPQEAHREIASLVKSGYIKVILTTNFDRLIEEALKEENVSCSHVYSKNDLEGLPWIGRIPDGNCILVKLHGDYLNENIKNTPEELRTYSDKVNSFLDEVFDKFGLILCGWSTEYDEALVNALKRRKNRRYATYWTKISPELRNKTKELVDFLGADVVPIMSADDFFNEFSRSVATLSKYGNSGQISIEALTAKVKRNLADDNRIGIYDAIRDESIKANELLHTDEFEIDINKLKQAGVDNISDEFIEKRLYAYQELIRPLSNILTNIVYYHGKEYESTILETFESVIVNRKYISSGSALIFLQLYPALLLQYSVGIIALYREDWLTLYSLIYEGSEIDSLESNIGEQKRIHVLQPGHILPRNRLENEIQIFKESLYSLVKLVLPSEKRFNDLFEVIEFIFSLIGITLSSDKYSGYLVEDRVHTMNDFISGRRKYLSGVKPLTVASLSNKFELLFDSSEESDYNRKIVSKTPVYAFLKKVMDKKENFPMFSVGFFSSDYEMFKKCYGEYAKISNPKQE